MTLRLLVYGTLRRGEPRAPLLAGARYLGTRKLSGYDLLDLGAYPGAVPGRGELVSEIYELPSPALLEVLDEVEGAAEKPPLFERRLVELEDGPAWLYVYAGAAEGRRRLGAGDWCARPQARGDGSNGPAS